MAGTSRSVAVLRPLSEAALRSCCKKGTRLGSPPCRHLSSYGILLPLNVKTCPPLTSSSAMKQQTRPFLNLAAPVLGAKRIEYAEVHRLQYSAEQMYDIVADVGSYRFFVPWCTGSRVISSCNEFLRAKLEVGFPPVVEHYVSEISMVPHRQIRAVSKDGRLFQHLETLWQFGPGLPGQPDSCTLKFYVSFEFKSVLHSQLANLFFDKVVKQMVSAFEHRAEKLYGPQAAVQKCKAVCCT
ncbi:coenzyme Q-binding protein COQ10 homolog B, mitochondrial-like [Hemicordylus capensis]|uniref:coenzyme Q-binding protein COQ10 homolog B, mitochondrial-like n=1 Tax=Hemicordylus capensis TaxID=884348 RepID=UPI0023039E6C|nr:coenzyme Q-binding protein COQ10 homolog B, mitochondrial-like [Hemicordylus capensis]